MTTVKGEKMKVAHRRCLGEKKEKKSQKKNIHTYSMRIRTGLSLFTTIGICQRLNLNAANQQKKKKKLTLLRTELININIYLFI